MDSLSKKWDELDRLLKSKVNTNDLENLSKSVNSHVENLSKSVDSSVQNLKIVVDCSVETLTKSVDSSDVKISAAKMNIESL